MIKTCECCNKEFETKYKKQKHCSKKCSSTRPRLLDKDIIGLKFNRLTVIDRDGYDKNNQVMWLFKCECGNTKRTKLNIVKRGFIKSCGCLGQEMKHRKKENHPGWKGGRLIDHFGYVVLNCIDHPNANKHKRIKEHTLIMSNYLGRPLKKGETIHHKNGVRDDNRIENLELWSSNHHQGQKMEDKINHAVEVLQLYAPHLLK